MNKSFCFSLGLCLFFSTALAKEENFSPENTDNKIDCILLGPNPSFIIRHKTSNSQTPLSLRLKAISSIPNMKILNVRPMLGNAHVISFTPLPSNKRSNEMQPKKKQVCYPRKVVNQWVSQIKQNINSEHIEPNFLIFPSHIEKSSSKQSDSKNDYSLDHTQWNVI